MIEGEGGEVEEEEGEEGEGGRGRSWRMRSFLLFDLKNIFQEFS